MSVYEDRDLPCPACGLVTTRSVCLSLNGGRVPAVVDEVRAGTFQRFTCEGCGAVTIADGPLIYTDFDLRHWVGCFPRPWEGAWRNLEQQPALSFQRAMIDHAPAIVRGDADGYRIRTVFGLPALAEKILVWDHDLDDLVIELLKLELLRSEGGPPLQVAPRLRFLAATDAGDLRFAADVGEAYVVPAGWYDAISGDLAAYRTTIDALSAGPFVDIGRFLVLGDDDPDWAAIAARPVTT